jgi:glycosyltransferase involved in cell wall biosynthesis
MVEITEEEDRMKKIVIDARESGTTTGRYIDNLVKYLHKLRSQYEITVLTKSHRVDYLKQIAPTFNVLSSDFKEFTFAEQLGLLKQIKSLQPNLVHFEAIQQPVLYRGKSVTTVHDLTTARFRNPSKNWLVFTIKQEVYKWLAKRVAHKSAAIISPSDFVRKDLTKFANIESGKIAVIYEAADKIPDKPEPLQVIDKTDQFIMYVGRPQPHKNLERLVQAFIKLKNDHPDLKLVFVGKKDTLYERLENYAKSQSAEDVVFTSFVSEGQLRWLYEHTAAYVFPSLSEGFGLPPLEAMMHGAPVVSSNATCLPEINGAAAHYFDPTDVKDMAAKVNEVLSTPKLRQKLIENGREQVKKYSWERTAKQTLAVYDQVLSQK